MGQPSVPGPGESIGATFVAVTAAADDVSSSTESATSGLLTMEAPRPVQTAEDAKAPQRDVSHERLARESADLMSRVNEQVRRFLCPLIQRPLDVICTNLHLRSMLALGPDIFQGKTESCSASILFWHEGDQQGQPSGH